MKKKFGWDFLGRLIVGSRTHQFFCICIYKNVKMSKYWSKIQALATTARFLGTPCIKNKSNAFYFLFFLQSLQSVCIRQINPKCIFPGFIRS